ncbi:MAG: hypothetical protein D3921_01355 [Candidatus Electrothrix sp. AW1]|nr:hypothetical protein [Candidatus Electrothrix sp. AX1]MCI5181177.1 hypothetical protein [Candidatus Electrothrix gigas]
MKIILADHPFWIGVVVSIVLVLIITSLPSTISTAQVRGITLIVYAPVFFFLDRLGIDQNDMFWFFLGSMIGYVSFALWILG